MGDDLKKIKKELDSAFNLLSVIPVKGDGVEVMTDVRQLLRNAYKIASKLLETAETGEENGG